MSGALLFGYVMLGAITAAMSQLFADDERIPDGAAPALVFVVWLLWPIAWVVGIAYGLWTAGSAVVLGFAVLWRRRRPRRLPRALVRRR